LELFGWLIKNVLNASIKGWNKLVGVDEVLEFLGEWRSAVECKAKFGWSQNECVHFMKWLERAKFIEVCKGSSGDVCLDVVDGRVFYYKRREVKDKVGVLPVSKN